MTKYTCWNGAFHRAVLGRSKNRIWLLLLGAAVIFAIAPLASADSVTVNYTATNLGGSLWEYAYNLSGTLSAGDDLAIYYPSGTSSSLKDLGTGGSGWTTFVLQPDNSIPADGEYDIVANTSNPSLSSTFETTFNYSGIGSPAAQSFTLYDSSYGILETGVTTTVPEIDANSGAGAVALLAGVLLISRGRKATRKPSSMQLALSLTRAK